MTQIVKKPRRVWRYVLIASLALNIAGVGALIGLGARQEGRMERTAPLAPGSIYLRALSHDSKKDLGRLMREQRGNRSERTGIFHQSYLDAIGVLRSDPFDRAQLSSIMEQQSELSATRLTMARQVLLDHIAAMSPVERREFADAIEQALKRH